MSCNPKSLLALLFFIAVCCVSRSALNAQEQQGLDSEKIDFNRQIRPILSDNCFYCHGFDESHRESGLRLDTFEGATESDAVVPHDPDSSELLRRMLSEDADEVMPPPETEKKLSKEQIDLVKRWIEQGGEYEQHWAWSQLIRPPVPNASEDQDTNPVDAFLKQGQVKNGSPAAAVASPRTLLRRLSFDLRGIPPTFQDVRTFEADPSQRNYLAFRDRWMSETEFAEHQAVRWLDLVRWADTSGFVSDEPIASGAYRAWVIESYSQNLPFDQFSIAQLAGDLLDDPTDQDLIASGYNRIVNTNCEAGAIEAEQLYKLKGEHVRAVGTVWLGLTTGCAECHDHKFDPISAKDYYSLAAFFDDLVEAGVYTPGDRREPLHYVHENSADRQLDRELQAKIAAIKQSVAATPLQRQPEWETAVKSRLGDKESRDEFHWIPAQIPAARVIEGEFAFRETDGESKRAFRETIAESGKFNRHHAAELMTGYLNTGGLKSDDEKDAWFIDVWIDPDSRPNMVGIQISHGDYGRLGWRTDNYETYYWGTDTSGTLEDKQPWSDPKRVKHLGPLPEASGWTRLQIKLNERIKPVGGQNFEATGMAWLHTGGRVRWGDAGLLLRTDKTTELELGEAAIRKWWDEPFNRQVYERRAEYVAKSIRTDRSKRDPVQQELAAEAFQSLGDQLPKQANRLSRLRRLESRLHRLRAKALPVLVSKSQPNRKQTRLLNRGDYQDTTGEFVSPAVPEFLSKNASDSGTGSRLDLANWLFQRDNPIVARVFVNRLWHQYFGRGLSETLDDSGVQGDWPSHPELLDWLACEFRDSGWDRNHMIRLLTSSQAYQSSSVPTPELLAKDPKNRLHTRQSRFRLPAESIRDTALQAAGLLALTDEIPIQSFHPYQPNVYWTSSDKVMFGSRHLPWNTSESRSQYQRSMYTFWKRQNIHPTMLAFDAPTRQECTAQRNITNTPGQALALLNDPIFVEAARGLATRIWEHSEEATDEQNRIQLAYQYTLQRNPRPEEVSVLQTLLRKSRAEFEQVPENARRLLQIGQLGSSAQVSDVELAAWTVVARALLNTHEFIYRP
ncbi:MAG: PSD1 and planctomycete cytochrome C domain-containing protein [Planctomycetota bacterium]